MDEDLIERLRFVPGILSVVPRVTGAIPPATTKRWIEHLLLNGPVEPFGTGLAWVVAFGVYFVLGMTEGF